MTHLTSNDPIEWFQREQKRAVHAGEPFSATRCALATASASGRPSLRFVLLKSVDERGFVFYTNYESRKATEMTENPYASIAFHWATIGVQVRVRGGVERVSEEQSDAYFGTRQRGSQIGAWASKQSRPLGDREELLSKVEQTQQRFPEEVPRPPHWGGYRVSAQEVEIWYDQFDRLHDRYVFTLGAQGYVRHRLNP